MLLLSLGEKLCSFLFMLCFEPRVELSNSCSIIDIYVTSDTIAG